MKVRIHIYGCRFTVAVDFTIKFVPFAEFRRDPPVRKLVVDDRTERCPTPDRHKGDRIPKPENRRFPGLG